MQPDAAKPTAQSLSFQSLRLMPEEAEPKTEQATEDVRVKPGQTLYQISVNEAWQV